MTNNRQHEIDLLISKGLELQQYGRFEEAKNIYEKILEIDSNHFDALHFLGIVYAISNNLEAAVLEMSKAIAVNPIDPNVLVNRANAYMSMGHFDKALLDISKSLDLAPQNPSAYFLQGNSLKALNKTEDAITSYKKAIHLNQNFAEVYVNLGNAYKDIGELDLALKAYDRSLEIRPDLAFTHYNRGVALDNLNKFSEAIDSFNDAIKLNPNYAAAYTNKGNALAELQQYDEAVSSLMHSLEIDNSNEITYYNLGRVLEKINKVDKSIDCYTKAIAINPDYLEAWINRGNSYEKINELVNALSDYNQAININKNSDDAYYNRGNVLYKMSRFKEALESFDKAIQLQTIHHDVFINRGNTLQELRKYKEALLDYDRAILLDAEDAEAYWNKSLASLALGNLKGGWGLYEWRFKSEAYIDTRSGINGPTWTGKESLQNKTILIHSEQGLGDTIHFCRYIRYVEEIGAKVIFQVQKPLNNLLKNLKGVSQIITKGSELPRYDFQCALMSLPLAFNTTIESIPNRIPYIDSDAELVSKWSNYFGQSGYKIAICWQGSTQGKVDVGRSFPVQMFEGIARIKGVRLISLQKNEGAEQLDNLPPGMKVEKLPENFDEGPNAFLDSAAIMKCVDLVITCDTSLTHLAGALGVKTWLPLQFASDWRWLLDRDDSPWYTKHRLFRQSELADWKGVFHRMECALQDYLSSLEKDNV